MKHIFLFILFAFSYGMSQAQELKCDVRVTVPKLQTADPDLFDNLEQEVEDFLNNEQWTDDAFEQFEQITCNIQINITEEVSATAFRADVAIQATRPVYGSDYETSLLTHVDRDVEFNYQPFQRFEYSQNNFTTNFAAIFAFYAYVILGLDYDTFSPLGGEPHFQTAQDIINTVPRSLNLAGWQPKGGDGNRSRYWLIQNILSPRAKDYRQAIYNYHLRSLDIMHADPEQAKENMLAALEIIDGVNKSFPNMMIIQAFSNAKSEEIIEIFKESSRTQKNKVYQIMAKLDPSRANQYRAITR